MSKSQAISAKILAEQIPKFGKCGGVDRPSQRHCVSVKSLRWGRRATDAADVGGTGLRCVGSNVCWRKGAEKQCVWSSQAHIWDPRLEAWRQLKALSLVAGENIEVLANTAHRLLLICGNGAPVADDVLILHLIITFTARKCSRSGWSHRVR